MANTALMLQAIRSGNLEELKQLLDDDGELRNWRSTFTVNWLHCCSALSVVRYLYELGLDANENHPEFGNALWNAAQCGREDVVEFLLQRKVEMNVSEPERNPLLAAIGGEGTVRIVRMLLEAGIDCGVTYRLRGAKKPMNALNLALEQGRRDIADALVAATAATRA